MLTSVFATTNFVQSLIGSAVILVITYVVSLIFNRLTIKALGRRSRSSAFEIGRVGSIVIWVAGILSVLMVLGTSDTVVAVVVLLVGAFLIISTRDFSSNWFAGQMIKTIAPFRVGDWIRVPGGTYGRVTRIESLYTILATPQNETIVIPNSKLTSEVVVDRTTSGSLKVPIDLEIKHEIEFGELTLAVSKITNDLSQYLAGTLEDGGRKDPEIYIVSTTPEYVKVRVFLRINNAAKEEEVASEFRKRFGLLGFNYQRASVSNPQRIEL